MRPLSELTPSLASSVEILATDVDGTLTMNGRFEAALLTRLEHLARAGIELVPVSGRPAGEVLALCRYLPGVSRGIAENGMVAVRPDAPTQILVKHAARDELLTAASRLGEIGGRALQLAPDAFCRLADLAFEREDREFEELRLLQDTASGWGLCLVWSNVHIHLSAAPPDKGQGLAKLLNTPRGLTHVAGIGDAPNDAGMFTPQRLGLSVGTAQVQATAQEFAHLPTFVTPSSQARGFCEFVDCLLRLRAP